MNSNRTPANPQPPGHVLPRHRVPAHLARRFHQICLGVSAEILDPEDLNPIEYALLAAADDNPGVDQRGLSARLGIDPASTSQMVDRLGRRGLLEQTIHPADRRARLLATTPAGTRLRDRLRPDLLAAQDRILRVISPEDQETLLDLLAKVVEGNDSYARPGNGRRKPRRAAEATATP
jgi:DNA-binding MarR family transcriptional regulator